MKTVFEKTGRNEYDIIALADDGLGFQLGRLVVAGSQIMVWFNMALTLDRVQEIVDLCRATFDNSREL